MGVTGARTEEPLAQENPAAGQRGEGRSWSRQRKDHSGLRCAGVTSELAGVKFSGSPKVGGEQG